MLGDTEKSAGDTEKSAGDTEKSAGDTEKSAWRHWEVCLETLRR